MAWLMLMAALFVYCVCQAVRDFRAKRYVWAGVAAVLAVAMLAQPVETHTVVVDLPAP